MGWGLIINGLYLNRVTKTELESALDDESGTARSIENNILTIAAYTSPVVTDGEQTWSLPEWVATKVPQLLEELKESYQNLLLINHAINNPQDVEES